MTAGDIIPLGKIPDVGTHRENWDKLFANIYFKVCDGLGYSGKGLWCPL